MNKKMNETIERELKELTVDYPTEDDINQTIFALYEYVPERKRTLQDFAERIKKLLKLSGKEFFQISSYFWISNLLFLLFGVVGTYFYADPLMTLFILSPIPFLTGLLEIFKSRDHGLMELEATLKYTVQQLIFSRMFIVTGFNLILNIFLIAWFYVSADIVLLFSQLLVYWVMPLTLISAIGLFITTKYRGTMSSPVLVSSWIVLSYAMTQFPRSYEMLQNISVAGSLIVITTSICCIIIQLKKIKGEIFIEFNC